MISTSAKANDVIALFRVLSYVLSNASVGLINLVNILGIILFLALLEREKMIEYSRAKAIDLNVICNCNIVMYIACVSCDLRPVH